MYLNGLGPRLAQGNLYLAITITFTTRLIEEGDLEVGAQIFW